MPAKNPVREASIDIEKQKKIVADIRALVGEEDQELLADMMEGETMIMELVDRLLVAYQTDKVLAAGIKKLVDDLSFRKKRIEARSETMKDLMFTVLEMAGLERLERPGGTASLKATAGSYEILEESEVPTQYFSRAEPTINRKSINEFYKTYWSETKTALEIRDQDARLAALNKIRENMPAIPGTAPVDPGRTIQVRIA